MLTLAILIIANKVEHFVSFVFIALNGGLTLIFFNKRADLFICLGLLFAIGADYYLILDGDYTIGLVFFLLAQVCYAIKTVEFATSRHERILNPSVRLFVSLVMILVGWLVLKGDFDILVALVAVYFSNLVLNCVFSFVHVKSQYLLAVGFLLFIACDVFVGMDFANKTNLFGTQMVENAGVLAWYFYPFSQILILLSIFFPYPFKCNKTKNTK